MNSDTESASNQVEEPVASSGINLLLGLLPLSACLVQIPFANILAPWIAWFCVRKDNPASRPAFRSVMNMQISWTLYGFVATAFILIIGLLSLMIFSSLSSSQLSRKGENMHTFSIVEFCESGNKEEASQCQSEAVMKGEVTKASSQEKPDAGRKASRGGKSKETETKLEVRTDIPVCLGMTMGMGIFAVYAFLLLIILLLGAGGIAWLAVTIMFAIRVKNDVNAKPPLTIRFLK